ncbi:hypothetical protein [Tahibacter amnicola]|uniref:Uncharacterized protein n=1 Tax=Tahibacter amnicola TaxID=2976241 RepID=A0ABY6BHA9_9GAMM|nr:hypothetical protein [Tahibacter amnicola]UXI69411.1 hypothetical protein N4264_07110 [Tahibacter amnicola]
MQKAARVPLPLKLAFTAFMMVMVPFYWKAYGPTNFLYFCDVAMFLTLAAVWTESPLLASLPAVGLIIPQIVWCVDFLATLVGAPLLGMTAYMFNPSIPLFARGLSSFHAWLPFVLLFLVARLGYDRRALFGWTAIAWVLMAIARLLLPAPPPDPANPNAPVNVNYVYGFSDQAAQNFMPDWAWLTVLYVGLPLLVFLPTHLLLNRWRGTRAPVPAFA